MSYGKATFHGVPFRSQFCTYIIRHEQRRWLGLKNILKILMFLKLTLDTYKANLGGTSGNIRETSKKSETDNYWVSKNK